MLKVNNIDVYYADVQALWDVSIEVKQGEIVSLVGANGAGKTTLLNTIAGLLHPTKGNIEFLEHDLTVKPNHRRAALGIAHIPEGRRLFPEMTVKQNLVMGSMSREAKAKREESMDWVFSLFPVLKERTWQAAGTLSGGEAQMLAIGRGLMARPRLVMMDEPSLGLAPNLVEDVMKITKEVNSQGITVLLVEQNIMHALRVCNRAYVLETGRVTLEGPGEELLTNARIKEAYMGI